MTEVQATEEETNRVFQAVADLLPSANPRIGVSPEVIAEHMGLDVDTTRVAPQILHLAGWIDQPQHGRWSRPRLAPDSHARQESSKSPVKAITIKGLWAIT